MKPLLLTIGLLISLDSFCQKYIVGLEKMASHFKNIEGQIIVTDSTVTTTFDGQSTTLKITSRKGYTIHVMDGDSEARYVVGHTKGRLHGFTYDCSITYHHARHHQTIPKAVFYCAVKRD